MIDDKFIPYWEKTLQDGKQKYLFKRWIHFLFLLFILDLVINRFVFGDTSLIEYAMAANWSRVFSKLGIWVGGSLLASYLQFWSLNKKYEKLKSGM